MQIANIDNRSQETSSTTSSFSSSKSAGGTGTYYRIHKPISSTSHLLKPTTETISQRTNKKIIPRTSPGNTSWTNYFQKVLTAPTHNDLSMNRRRSLSESSPYNNIPACSIDATVILANVADNGISTSRITLEMKGCLKTEGICNSTAKSVHF